MDVDPAGQACRTDQRRRDCGARIGDPGHAHLGVLGEVFRDFAAERLPVTRPGPGSAIPRVLLGIAWAAQGGRAPRSGRRHRSADLPAISGSASRAAGIVAAPLSRDDQGCYPAAAIGRRER
jgi:hypothetical protein